MNKVKKFRIFINFQKEEKWLEQMALQGWLLIKQSVFYTFIPAPPQQTNIKIDYRLFAKKQDFIDYITLFEDSGWKHISGTKMSGNQYFIQVDNNNEDIFSDSMSRAGRYKRAANMMLCGAILFLPLVIVAIQQGTFFRFDVIIDPKLLYYTPGLWERNGIDFWSAFLFETPFALMRGFSWSLWSLFILAYFFLTVRSWITYKKAIEIDVNE